MDKHIYCVIMAGGKGERFWPVSTDLVPKPFVSLTGKRTMIQMTLDRLGRIAPNDRIFVILGKEHLAVARKQLSDLPERQFIIEPEGKDTAPCIGFAAVTLSRLDPEALMVVVPADHYIPEPEVFAKTIGMAADCATQRDYLVTIGIMPTRPEVGYGYMFAEGAAGALSGAPSRSPASSRNPTRRRPPNTWPTAAITGTAASSSGARRWCWKASAGTCRSSRKGSPQYSAARDKEGARVAERFNSFEKISIDYGLMEKADNVLMVKADFAWDDVGTWGSLNASFRWTKTGTA